MLKGNSLFRLFRGGYSQPVNEVILHAKLEKDKKHHVAVHKHKKKMGKFS